MADTPSIKITDYLSSIPHSIPPGKIIAHNNVRPTKRLGDRGFRAWLGYGAVRRISIGLVSTLLTILPATAQDYEKGAAAAKRGDYATALMEWRPLAEKGHAVAQYNLGLMFRRGQGVPQDNTKAVKWCRRAAEQGLVSAQNNLGFMYERGRGVPKDYAKAVKWLRIIFWTPCSPSGHAATHPTRQPASGPLELFADHRPQSALRIAPSGISPVSR